MPPPTNLSSVAEMLEVAKASYEAGDYEAVLSLLSRAPSALRNDRRTIDLARRCYLQMGSVSRVLGETNRMRRLTDDPAVRQQARFALGKLRETDPSWLPPVPPPPPRSLPEPGVVLHLLKESLPYSETGFTFRSRMTLEAQRNAGYSPVVVTSLGFPRYKGIEDVPALELVDGFPHHRLDFPTEPRPVTSLPFDVTLTEQAQRTAPIADEVRPSLIQAGTGFRGFDTALVALSLARRADIPFVYEVRGFQEATWTKNVARAERGEYYRRRLAQERRCMNAATKVITIADAMREEIISRGVDGSKVMVVPNAVHVERFVPRDKDPELVAELELEDRLAIGYISNLGPREGLEDLIRATKLLESSGRDVVCLIVGDGPQRRALESLRDELGLTDSVRFTGHVSNERIEDYYALIDVFVVPRIDDRAARLVTPLKPLEAMAMKRPVAVSNLPALRELARPEERGLVFDPSSPASLAEVVGTMLDQPQLRERLANQALEWVRAERSLDSNVRRYKDALGTLLQT